MYKVLRPVDYTLIPAYRAVKPGFVRVHVEWTCDIDNHREGDQTIIDVPETEVVAFNG